MLKKISQGIFCAGALFAASHALAATHTLSMGIMDFKFPPNDPQIFENPFHWPVNTTCKLISPDEQNDILAAILQKRGIINERPLSEGESFTLTIRSGDKLKISAEPGAKASITNQGEHTFIARCMA